MNGPDKGGGLAENPGMRGQPEPPAAPAPPGVDPGMPADHAAPVAPTGTPADPGARIAPVGGTADPAEPPLPPDAPGPPAEQAPEAGIEVEGEKWIARPAGVGSYGTGITARASVMAIHFFRFAEPGHAVREVLTSTGDFAALYDEELLELFRRSRPIVGRS